MSHTQPKLYCLCGKVMLDEYGVEQNNPKACARCSRLRCGDEKPNERDPVLDEALAELDAEQQRAHAAKPPEEPKP